jgi:hypothetical protein
MFDPKVFVTCVSLCIFCMTFKRKPECFRKSVLLKSAARTSLQSPAQVPLLVQFFTLEFFNETEQIKHPGSRCGCRGHVDSHTSPCGQDH